MKFLNILLLMLFFIGCSNNESAIEKNIIKNGDTGQLVDSLLTPYINELRALTDNEAGLAIGIAKADEIIYARTFGYAQIEKAQKVDFDTRFHLASVSKPFSAIAIAKLIQDNKIKLDDHLVELIPELKTLGNGFDKITIENILTHTSGIPRHIAPDDWLKPSYGVGALEENIEIVKQHELDFTPGTKYNYSNAAFDILGIVISRVSGKSFNEYIEKEILEPIGMMNTGFKKSKDVFPDDWALSYSYGLNTQELKPYPYNERLFPSSGVVSSLRDMCKWGQMHLAKGTLNGVQILDKYHFDLVVSPKYDTPWGDKIGLSWFLQSYLEHPNIMHTGFDTGFEAMMYIYPEDDMSIVVMANRDFSRTGRIINAASEILFNEKLKTYTVSAKYPFAEAYNKGGVEMAKSRWDELKKDTLDHYYVDDEDILTIGAILENGQNWKASKEVLEHYLTIDKNSTYAWRLLGNANLNLGDTLTAKSCYEQTLKINPNYEKGRIAIEKLLKKEN